MSRFDEIARALVDLDVARTANLTGAALEEGVPAIEILNRGLLPAMASVGEQFQSGEMFLPEVLLAGKAMKRAMALLGPALQSEDTPARGRVVIGTVKDDIHDIGKHLVIMMLEGQGWAVTDLGVDVPVERFCAVVRDQGPHLLGLSALLSSTVPRMQEVIAALKADGLREQVKIMVGGAAVTQAHADRIGADGYAANAVEAVRLAEALLGE